LGLKIDVTSVTEVKEIVDTIPHIYGRIDIPLSSSSILQQSALQNIAEFMALVLERCERFLGKRIDIASDEVTGEQAAEILSTGSGYRIKYVHIPLEQVYQANEDMARMYEWYESAGTGIDISALHQEYPEVNWLTFKDWVKSQNWNEIM
jgi:hypothetical protein